MLTGRWKLDLGPTNCVTIPASAVCKQEFSIEPRQGYTATGLNVTAITEITIFRGALCAPANLIGRFRGAQDITLEAADTSIPDDTVAPSGTIAVRRGLVTGERVDVSEVPNATAFFDDCSALAPDPAPQTPEACVDTVSLRIEADAQGKPLLLLEQDSACQPGSTPPAARYTARWSLESADGLTKLP